MDVNQERDNDFDKALRPLSFDDFIGQKPIISNLKIFVEASTKEMMLWTIHCFTDHLD